MFSIRKNTFNAVANNGEITRSAIIPVVALMWETKAALLPSSIIAGFVLKIALRLSRSDKFKTAWDTYSEESKEAEET